MIIEHVTRKGDTYYLHEGKTKTGKPKYFFSRKREGTLAEAVPAGFEVYENPNAQVFLRKALPRLVTAEEVGTVERGVREHAKLPYFLIDVKGKDIVVHLPNETGFLDGRLFAEFGLKPGPALLGKMEKLLSYMPMMRFTLVDEQDRQFAVWRWCFRGAIDDWFPLAGGGDLKKLVAAFCPHLGRESFYELM